MYSLEVRLSHELLDLLGRLMLPPLGVGPPASYTNDPGTLMMKNAEKV